MLGEIADKIRDMEFDAVNCRLKVYTGAFREFMVRGNITNLVLQCLEKPIPQHSKVNISQ